MVLQLLFSEASADPSHAVLKPSCPQRSLGSLSSSEASLDFSLSERSEASSAGGRIQR